MNIRTSVSVSAGVSISVSTTVSSTSEYLEDYDGAAGSRIRNQGVRTEDAGRVTLDSDTSYISRYVKLFIMQDVSVFNGLFVSLSKIRRYSCRSLDRYIIIIIQQIIEVLHEFLIFRQFVLILYKKYRLRSG